MDQLDTITVIVGRREEVCADKADIYLSIDGPNFITGIAALKKAREVAQLVADLLARGVKDHDIALLGVLANQTAGAVGRNTPATYRLRIHCPNLELLSDTLGVITAHRTVTLETVAWRFPDEKLMEAKWLEGCLVSAKEKAAQIASALGVKLLAVHSLSEKWIETAPEPIATPAIPAASATGTGTRPVVNAGFSLAITKQAEVQVEVKFRVSNYA